MSQRGRHLVSSNNVDRTVGCDLISLYLILGLFDDAYWTPYHMRRRMIRCLLVMNCKWGGRGVL